MRDADTWHMLPDAIQYDTDSGSSNTYHLIFTRLPQRDR